MRVKVEGWRSTKGIFTFLAFLVFLLAFATTSPALTRAELVERLRAAPATKVDGLVQVIADCPADMRREYQLPVAGYVADTCRTLYAGSLTKSRRFDQPGIIVILGDLRTNNTNVVSRVCERSGGVKYTRIYVPAPGYADMRALKVATARAFLLAVKGEETDDAGALRALIAADPEWRVADACRRLDDWSQRGVYSDGMDDEEYLKLSRKVQSPGRLTRRELDTFASRLMLYPTSHSVPFCSRYDVLDFKTAIKLRKRDPNIRFAAYVKAKQLLIFGAGRGEELDDAAKAYHEFLIELARDEKSDGELLALLDSAEGKLGAIKP